MAAEHTAGIIGSAILQRFHVVFDYAGERLIVRERDYGREALDFDKSGIFMISDHDDRSVYRVIDVIDGSPADEAGVQIGDIIRELDGKPANNVSLEQARRLFRRKEGTRFELVYEREGELHSVRLTLRKVI